MSPFRFRDADDARSVARSVSLMVNHSGQTPNRTLGGGAGGSAIAMVVAHATAYSCGICLPRSLATRGADGSRRWNSRFFPDFTFATRVASRARPVARVSRLVARRRVSDSKGDFASLARASKQPTKAAGVSSHRSVHSVGDPSCSRCANGLFGSLFVSTQCVVQAGNEACAG